MSIVHASDDDRAHINAWLHIAGVGAHKLFLLARHFSSFHDAWTAPHDALVAAGFSTALATHVVASRPTINVAEKWDVCTQSQITLITTRDTSFPATLQDIPSAPFALYVRGDAHALTRGGVTVVGARKAGDYGMRCARLFAEDITLAHIPIISGLALGIDAIAHTVAVECDGVTIAVLGGGIDDATITPRTHLRLAHRILATGGALVSEYPPGTQPNRGTFPARNRLMAALADAVLIVEAAANSGTLTTAHWAHKYAKHLFAIPGSIFADTAVGPNALIRDQRAVAALTPDDVIVACTARDTTDDAPKRRTQKTRASHLATADPLHEKLARAIAAAPDGIHINTLIAKHPADAANIPAALMMMELAGALDNLGNQTYVVRK